MPHMVAHVASTIAYLGSEGANFLYRTAFERLDNRVVRIIQNHNPVHFGACVDDVGTDTPHKSEKEKR
jgi:hypothetical protein